MRVITNDMIVEMNEMYSDDKSYKTIANLMNISPYTVKKYINNPKEENKFNITLFNKPLPDFETTIFRTKDWGELCVLGEEELGEIRKLWEEMEF